jgi:hypothetical protein
MHVIMNNTQVSVFFFFSTPHAAALTTSSFASFAMTTYDAAADYINITANDNFSSELETLNRILALEKEKFVLRFMSGKVRSNELQTRLSILENEVETLSNTSNVHITESCAELTPSNTLKEDTTHLLQQLAMPQTNTSQISLEDSSDSDEDLAAMSAMRSIFANQRLSDAVEPPNEALIFSQRRHSMGDYRPAYRSNQASKPLVTLPNALSYGIKLRDDSTQRLYRDQSRRMALELSASTSPHIVKKTQRLGRMARQESIQVLETRLRNKLVARPSLDGALGLPSPAHTSDDDGEEEDEDDEKDMDGSTAGIASSMSEDIDRLENVLEFCIIEADWRSLTSPTPSSGETQLSSPSSIAASGSPSPLVPAKLTWRYPREVNESVNNTKHVTEQSFFFPSGVKVELTSQAVTELKTQAYNYRRHIVPFSDRKGQALYACCLTVYHAYPLEEVNAIDASIVQRLRLLKTLTQAARVLQKAFRLHAEHKKTKAWRTPVPIGDHKGGAIHGSHSTMSTCSEQNSSSSGYGLGNGSSAPPGSAQHISALSRKQSTFFSMLFRRSSVSGSTNSSTNSSSNKPAGAGPGSNSSHGLAGGEWSRAVHGVSPSSGRALPMPMPMIHSHDSEEEAARTKLEMLKELRDSLSSREEHEQGAEEAGSCAAAAAAAAVAVAPQPVPSSSAWLDAQRTMTVVAQKAYCIITPVPEYTFIFTVLDAIAEAEKPFSSSPALSSPEELCAFRNKCLTQVHAYFVENIYHTFSSAYLQQLSTNFTVPRGVHSHASKNSVLNRFVNRHHPRYVSQAVLGILRRGLQVKNAAASQDSNEAVSTAPTAVPSSSCIVKVKHYMKTLRIDHRSLLTTKEWSLAVLMAHVSTSTLFKVINLLLLEKSLVIYGAHPGIVTAVALGVHNLIAPFVWEGVFIPLVPDTARELFTAPVPLIIGTISPPRMEDLSDITAVLYLADDTLHVPLPLQGAVMSEQEYRSKFKGTPPCNSCCCLRC